MKIVRNILGADIEIELTIDEVRQVYLEQEETCDIQSARIRINSYYGRENEFLKKYGVDLDSINNDADLIYSIAAAMRHNIDRHDIDNEFALDEAFNNCLLGLDG